MNKSIQTASNYFKRVKLPAEAAATPVVMSVTIMASPQVCHPQFVWFAVFLLMAVSAKNLYHRFAISLSGLLYFY